MNAMISIFLIVLCGNILIPILGKCKLTDLPLKVYTLITKMHFIVSFCDEGSPKIRVITEDFSASKEALRPARYDKCTERGHTCIDFDECCQKEDICAKGLNRYSGGTKTCGLPFIWDA